VNEEVEPVPVLVELGEHGFDGGDILDVAGQHEVRSERLGERSDTFPERIALVRERQGGAMRGQHLGDPPSDGMIVRDPHDEAAPSLHQSRQAKSPVPAGSP
jgi:hypothetical protein